MSTGMQHFAARRERVREKMGADSVLILVAGPELHVGPDTELRYVVDADLYYLTGYTEPEAVCVLTRDAFVLFVRPRDEERELWTGVRGGVEAAQASFGATAAHPIESLESEIRKIMAGTQRVFVRPRSGRAEVDLILANAVDRARRARARSGRGPMEQIDPGMLLDDLRLHKDAQEVAAMRKAARISVEGFRDAARAIAGGVGEWEIEAALQHGFRKRRASGEAFSSIVAGGANATVLHYTSNDDVLAEGDIVLVDAGARADMYCGDITRSYAVGRVSAARRGIHDIVRSAHAEAMKACVPGNTIDDVDGAARRELIRGMIELGLVKGTVDEVIARDEYKRFFPHRTCHWLGLDVHDVGTYANADGSPRRLESGMVFTVEPGLYIPRSADGVAGDLRGVGVRLEDDVLITDTGVEVLTGALPLDIEPEAAFA